MSKMFEERVSGKYIMTHIYRDGEEMTPSEVVGLLNHFHQENNYLSTIRENQQQMILKLKEENEQLKKENNMLKITIDRNESYIMRLTHQSDWHC